jgi:hypothetical protein
MRFSHHLSRQSRSFTSCYPEIQLKDTDWQYEDELELLRDDIKLIADQCRADETKKMVNAIEVSRAMSLPLDHVSIQVALSQRSLRKQLAEPVEIGLGKPRDDMWDDLLRVFKTMLETSEEVYRAKAKSRFFLGA